MATDYIKRQAALNIVCPDDCPDCPDGGCDLYRRMKKVPAADVVEVVRCRECAHLCRTGFGTWCFFHPQSCGSLGPDDFCSAGERRPDNADK